MSIFLYARVSSKSSATSGLSIESQVAQGLAYAKRNIPHDTFFPEHFAHNEPGVFADKGVSGWSKCFLERPAAARLNTLAKPGDHIICYAIDRLARNLRDFSNTTHHFETKGIFVHYIAESINTATANGRLQANIRGAIAQWYSDILSERIREAKLIKKLGYGAEKVKKDGDRWIGSEYDFSKDSVGRTYGTIYRYERVSDISQYTSGLSLEYQSQRNEQYVKDFCATHGSVDGGAFVEDAISAFNVKFCDRPKGRDLLNRLKPGDDIVFYRSDRAWRNTRDAMEMIEELTKRGIYVHLVNEGLRTDTNGGVDWIALLTAVAQLESSLKRRRKLDADEACKKSGRPWNNPPTGWKIKRVNGTKKLVLDWDKCVRMASLWILHNEIGMSDHKLVECAHAWMARDDDRTFTLRDAPKSNKDARVWLRYANTIKDTVPESVWANILVDAWNHVRTPMLPKYWGYIGRRWNYNDYLHIESPVEV